MLFLCKDTDYIYNFQINMNFLCTSRSAIIGASKKGKRLLPFNVQRAMQLVVVSVVVSAVSTVTTM